MTRQGVSPSSTLPTPTEVGTPKTPALPTGQSPCLVAIAGPSCSGKTELARRLCALLPEFSPVHFPLDGYYHDLTALPPGAAERHNFDSPDSLEAPLLIGHLHALAEGRAVLRPVYDYAAHRRTGVERVEPGGLLLVEGLFALHWEELLPLYALTLFVDLGDGACLERRLARDRAERGASEAFTRWQWAAHVKPMADRFVRPTRARAALVLNGADPAEENAAKAADAVRRLPRPPGV
jgi:uridine kinase